MCLRKKDKRKVQGVPQSQAASLPRHQDEEETDNFSFIQKQKNKRKDFFNSFITFKNRDAINILESIFYIYKGSKTFSLGYVLSLFRVL